MSEYQIVSFVFIFKQNAEFFVIKWANTAGYKLVATYYYD